MPVTFSPEVAAFLDRPLHAVLATSAGDGRISQSVVWFQRDGDAVLVIFRPESVKARQIAASSSVSLLVLDDGGGAYVRVDGTARLDGEISPDQRRALITPYVADPEAWLAGHVLPTPNALVRITADRVAAYGV